MAFFPFRLDLLLLRLVLRGRGGPVGLRLRARLLAAASSARHAGGSSLLFASSVVAVQLLCSSCADCRLCSCCCVAHVGSRLAAAMAHLCWSTRGHRAMLIDAQRRRIYSRIGPGSPAMAPKPRDFFMLKICLEVHGDTYDRPVSVRELNEFRSLISLKKGG